MEQKSLRSIWRAAKGFQQATQITLLNAQLMQSHLNTLEWNRSRYSSDLEEKAGGGGNPWYWKLILGAGR